MSENRSSLRRHQAAEDLHDRKDVDSHDDKRCCSLLVIGVGAANLRDEVDEKCYNEDDVCKPVRSVPGNPGPAAAPARVDDVVSDVKRHWAEDASVQRPYDVPAIFVAVECVGRRARRHRR